MRATTLAAGFAAAGFLAACSSNTPTGEQTSTSVATDRTRWFRPLPERAGRAAAPGPAAGPPPGVDQDTWHGAMEACSSLAPGPAS
ncbi:MAG TPA: hypothetical protein VER34_17605 [Mycobacterium sp.]|nr:hypothetical protein [Mycobacterium sp.]